MLPDPRWDDALSADRFIPQPCQCIELISRKYDDVEVITRDMTAETVVPWLDGQTPTDQGSPPTFRTRLVIFPVVLDSDGFPCVPIPQDHVKRLVNDLGFPDRFFINLIVRRRLSTRITTPAGDCWLMRDWLFSAVTLRRTRHNDILSIIVSGNQHKYSNIEPFIERYVSSKAYHLHPLFPMLLIADAALEDYRDISDRILTHSEDLHHSLGIPFQHGGPRVRQHYQRDPAAGLADIASERERLTRLSGDLKAFHASLRNLLSLQDGRDGSNEDTGSLQSISTQSGGRAIPPLSPMLQYLVSASGDILERITATDTRLQFLFPVMQIRLAQRDTEVSLRLARTSAEIAIAAKRDSSSMKVIAVLTTLFLPGAFVGTLLSTPEYSSESPGSWRYWAITVPLTAAVMLMLMLWMWWIKSRQQRVDAEVARTPASGLTFGAKGQGVSAGLS